MKTKPLLVLLTTLLLVGCELMETPTPKIAYMPLTVSEVRQYKNQGITWYNLTIVDKFGNPLKNTICTRTNKYSVGDTMK